MKIYLASRWSNQGPLKIQRARLQSLGAEVTSGWLDEVGDAPEIAAQRDIDDIDRADTLLLWPDLSFPVKSLYGGMFVEFGYALAKGKQVWVVEPQTSPCIFIQLPQVVQFKTWDDLYAAVQSTIPATG